ncbi:hypothetical protein BDR26DRAFT_862755 [Obelidium mucronatum]|nr:hypothetical protein BDR26DRAFT_862755 [Obelidium mucronatum]
MIGSSDTTAAYCESTQDLLNDFDLEHSFALAPSTGFSPFQVPTFSIEHVSTNDCLDAFMTPATPMGYGSLSVPATNMIATSPHIPINSTMVDDLDLLLSPNHTPFINMDTFLSSPFIQGAFTPHVPTTPHYDMIITPTSSINNSVSAISPALSMNYNLAYLNALNDAVDRSDPTLDSQLLSLGNTSAATPITTSDPYLDDLFLADLNSSNDGVFSSPSITVESSPSSFCMFPSSSNTSTITVATTSSTTTTSAPQLGKGHACQFYGCNRSFSSLATLKSHYLVHTGEKPFQCTLCSKAYSTNNRLKIHMRDHNGEKPYACDFAGCTYRAKQKCGLQIHMVKHMTLESLRTVPCTACGKLYKNERSLGQHLLKDHKQ